MNYIAKILLGLEPQPDYRPDRSELKGNQAKVYEYLLRYGPAMIVQVASELEMNFNSAYSSLRSLRDKGFAVMEPGEPRAVWLAKDGRRIVDRRKG